MQTNQPKKYVRINGVMKRNPEYTRWIEAQQQETQSPVPDYPSADAVPIDDNDIPQQTKPFADSGYASALVVGNEVSPFNSQLYSATETHANAVALDPWSKEPTATVDDSFERIDTPAPFDRPTYQSPHEIAPQRPPSVQHRQHHHHPPPNHNQAPSYTRPTYPTIPAALLEDPLRKKTRRRRRRRGRMMAGGAAGFVVGTILLGPIGGVIIGASAVGISRTASKIGERRKDKRVKKRLERQLQSMPTNQPFDQGRRIIVIRR